MTEHLSSSLSTVFTVFCPLGFTFYKCISSFSFFFFFRQLFAKILSFLQYSYGLVNKFGKKEIFSLEYAVGKKKIVIEYL